MIVNYPRSDVGNASKRAVENRQPETNLEAKLGGRLVEIADVTRA